MRTNLARLLALFFVPLSQCCFAGPSVNELQDRCKGDGRGIPELSKCLEIGLAMAYPGWESKDGQRQLKGYLDQLKAIEQKVHSGELSAQDGQLQADQKILAISNRQWRAENQSPMLAGKTPAPVAQPATESKPDEPQKKPEATVFRWLDPKYQPEKSDSSSVPRVASKTGKQTVKEKQQDETDEPWNYLKTLPVQSQPSTSRTSAQATSLVAPSFASIQRMCKAQGHKMPTMEKCLSESLDKFSPGWRVNDEDAESIQWYLNFVGVVGRQVKKKEISNADAEKMAEEELAELRARKQMQNEIAARKIEDQRRAQVEQQRAQQQQAEALERRRAEQRRIDAMEAQRQAYIQAQEEQVRQAKNQAMLDAGLRILEMNRPPPPPPRMPHCVYNNLGGTIVQNCF